MLLTFSFYQQCDINIYISSFGQSLFLKILINPLQLNKDITLTKDGNRLEGRPPDHDDESTKNTGVGKGKKMEVLSIKNF